MNRFQHSVVIPPDISGFYRALDKLHRSQLLFLPPIALSEGECNFDMKLGLPLIEFVKVNWDEEKLEQVLNEVVRVISAYRPHIRVEMKLIQGILRTSGMNLGTVAESFIKQCDEVIEDLAVRGGINGEILRLVLLHTVKPFVVNYARSLEIKYPTDSWERNYCPFCGGKPLIASKAKDNSGRFLHCSLCETKWQFKNLKCPHCLSEDHETLSWFTVEDDTVFKVNLCQKCKGYIKTFEEGKLIEDNNPFLIDAGSLHLDFLAESLLKAGEHNVWSRRT